MKLVNCHHVRKRRRWLAHCRKPVASGEELLLKMMMIAGAKSHQPNCDLERERRRQRRSRTRRTQDETSLASAASQTNQTKATTEVKPAGVVCRNQANSNHNRFKIFNRLLSYSTLMCLIICNDSADKLADWSRTGDKFGLATPPRPGLMLAANAESDANRLYEDLMMTYNRLVTPTRNVSEKPIVRLGLKLSQLMDVNLKNQMMTINLWLNQEWSDYKLEWDPDEYGGITEINLPAEQIWLPDIVLYNSAEGYFAVSIMTKAKVRYDGYVVWNPPVIFRSSCQIDITHFPFDIQNCRLKFGSWTFGDKLDLRHVNESAVIIERGTDLSEYYQNVEWDIMRASAERNMIKYECCPDPYYDITFHFKLRRKPLFYTVNLILPCVGITFFSFLVFYLPSDSGEKVTLTISILVSLIFFLSVLIETIPSTSLAMPLLGKYLVFTMILITLSVCATVGVLNIHFRTPSTHSMPPWVKRWCMDILPKYLFMSVPQYQQNNNILPEQLIYLHNPAYATQAVTLPLNLPSQLVGTLPNSVVNQHQTGSSQKTCCPTASINVPNQTLTTTSHQYHANQLDAARLNELSAPLHNRSINSRQPFQELNVAHLVANNPLQSRPTTFLPYLQSEAARRLQLQRSRSSERDNKSMSDNQPTSTSNEAGGGSGAASGGDAKSDRVPSRQDGVSNSVNSGVVSRSSTIDSGKRRKSRTSSSNVLWRLLKLKKVPSLSEQDTESNREQQKLQQQQHPQQRHSRSSSSTSSLARNEYDEDDDYRHHRHFQARASICSNNLWRIGPTRRCSLAVPITNYSTYYRPLAQLQHHPGSGGGSMLNTISGGGCLPPIVAHCHMHAENSDTTTSSSEASNYKSGNVIGGLINQTTNLVHPDRMFGQQTLESHQIGPMTSGGFISVNSQMQRGVNAIPPRRSVTPSSYQSESQNNMPTPPPPLPPDFAESSMVNNARTMQASLIRTSRNQETRVGNLTTSSRKSNDQEARLIQMSLLAQDHNDPESSSSMTTTIQHPQYVPTEQPHYSQTTSMTTEQMLKTHQQSKPGVNMLGGRSMSNNRSFVNDVEFSDVAVNRQATNDNTMSEFGTLPMLDPTFGGACQSSHYLSTGQQSMSRSRSTGHRLSKMARDLPNSGIIPSNMGQRPQRHIYQAFDDEQQHQLPNYGQTSTEFLNIRRQQPQQHQSIGRQLGQAYIQRLQRQPAICSLQHQSRTMLPFNRDVNSFAMANLATEQSRLQSARFGDHGFYQTRLAGEPSIDMLRRSKSQTSLYRKPQGCLTSVDCRHCMMEGVIMNKDLTAANQLCTATRSLHRPQSETRDRLNSTGYHSSRVDGCFRSSGQNYQQVKRFDDEVDQGISHCASASVRTMPIERAKNYFNDENVCRCSALGDSIVVTPNTNQPHQLKNQLSTLNLLKLINEVDKAIQNAMFIAQHIDNLDEFESVKENWKYIAMVIDRIFLIVFLFICIVGTVAIFAMVPWTYYLNEKPIDLDLTRLQVFNLTSGDTMRHGCP